MDPGERGWDAGAMEPYLRSAVSELAPPRDVRRDVFGVVVGAAATVVLYLLFLGWNATRDPRTCTGPYEAGQVVGLALALAAVVVVCALWGGEWAAAGAASVTVTVVFILDVLTVDDPCAIGASFWPIGAGLLLVGSGLGLGLVAAAATLVRWLLRMRTRTRARRGADIGAR